MGANCLSVLTDKPFFQGDLAYLTAIHEAVRLPVLRKEFILDRYQLLEARAAGADAVLLIAEILPGNRLKQLFDDATTLGLHVLVELHDAEQLSRVVDSGASLIGINNRDLRTFKTRLQHTLDLLPRVLPTACVVSESGIKNHNDCELLGAGWSQGDPGRRVADARCRHRQGAGLVAGKRLNTVRSMIAS